MAEQEKLWDSLAPSVAAEQMTLNAELAEEFLEASRRVVIVAPQVDPAARISTYSCAGSNNPSYKVAVNGYATQCFTGAAGTYVLTTQMTDWGGAGDARLYPGTHKGQVYYMLGNGYYWSTVRGPHDYTWRHFNISYDHKLTVLRVRFT
ncbi:hypothetical protein EBM89_08190 [Cellulomonas triticagri]|uniref:Uncharacterized protein n=1 Tax=Cellulomonas triticagri TaxID=2483352 RepID=A0A3M2JLS8_9CELL|nr:hypothetical protein EBM89_08190 [Cellulomonas triticagri]